MKLPARLSKGENSIKNTREGAMVAHTKGLSHPSIWEEETGGSLQAQGQPGVHKFKASQNYTATLSFKEEKKDHSYSHHKC